MLITYFTILKIQSTIITICTAIKQRFTVLSLAFLLSVLPRTAPQIPVIITNGRSFMLKTEASFTAMLISFVPCAKSIVIRLPITAVLIPSPNTSVITATFIGPPPMPRIFEIALPQWWSKITKEGWFQALPLLRIEEVQNTRNLAEHDLWRYMKTYAPRSWAEAFYLTKTLGREVLNAAVTTGNQFSVLDIGCNVGCAMLGVLDALAARGPFKRPIKVVAVDGNATALDLLDGFNKARASEDDPCAVATRDIELVCINRTFAEEVQASTLGKFNIIVASKFLGECGAGSFLSFLEYAKSHLDNEGVAIIIEVLKHEKALRDAISGTGITDVVVKRLAVKIGSCGEKCSDNEEVVVTVIYKNNFN